MKNGKPLVGIINSNQDLVDILQEAIKHHGFHAAGEHLRKIREEPFRYEDFISKNDPRVIIVDVPIPYDENWEFTKQLIASEQSKGRSFVITTTNKARMEELIGPIGALELVGKPFDISELMEKVRNKINKH